MVTFTINIPQMLAYIPYMDPMYLNINRKSWNSQPSIGPIARICPFHQVWNMVYDMVLIEEMMFDFVAKIWYLHWRINHHQATRGVGVYSGGSCSFSDKWAGPVSCTNPAPMFGELECIANIYIYIYIYVYEYIYIYYYIYIDYIYCNQARR